MSKWLKMIAVFGCGLLFGIIVSVSLYYWAFPKSEMPVACGGKENQSLIKQLSVNHTWKGRGKVEKTLGSGLAGYDDWQTTDGVFVRHIEERYACWGEAHEALVKRLAQAKSVCQYGATDDAGEFVDKNGTQSRVVAVIYGNKGQNRIEILTAFEYENTSGSMLQILQAPSLIHALAVENSYYRFDY